MSAPTTVTKFTWNDMPKERVQDRLDHTDDYLKDQ